MPTPPFFFISSHPPPDPGGPPAELRGGPLPADAAGEVQTAAADDGHGHQGPPVVRGRGLGARVPAEAAHALVCVATASRHPCWNVLASDGIAFLNEKIGLLDLI